MKNPSSRFVLPFAPAAARLTYGIALFVILVSLLVIMGWIFDIAELKSFYPKPVTMKPLVAVGLLLSGAALWLLHRSPKNLHQRMLGQIFSALVATLGGLVLLEYLGNINLDLDQWLFPNAVAEEDVLYPGRPSPSAAYCLFLSGMALIALDGKRDWIVPFLALQILVFALLTLIGHAYDVSALYQLRPYAAIPLHAAASLFVLGIGILSARPERYLAWLIGSFAGSVMARNLLPTAVLLPFAIGLIQLKGQQSGLYSTDFGWALFVTFHILAFSGMIYLAAKLLNKTDAEREIVFAALQEGEERFRLLFEASPNGLLLGDLEGKVRLANRQAAALFNYEAGHQLQGRKLETLLKNQAADRPYFHQEPFAVKFLSRTKNTGNEMIGVRRDGTQFTVQVDGSSLVTREGNMLLITLVDVTSRKFAEIQRDRFVALADASTEFIGMCDQNFKPFYVNSAGMRMVGIESLTAACNVGVQDYFFPEDQAYITDEFFPRVLRDGNAEVEIRFRHFQTGEAIWMLYNVFNLRTGQGEIMGWATVSRNIHQRKQAEEALRESVERLRLAWKATRDVIWDWDIVHDAQRWSEVGVEVFGWRDAVETPQTASWGLKRVHPEDQQRVMASVRAVLDAPVLDNWEDEYRFLRSDGSYANVLDRGFVIRDHQGKPVRMIGAMQDITERKRSEEKMQELNQALERQVALRTQELEAINARLKDELIERQLAESRAVASLQEKEVLLKEIHHRVKNNLQVIASLLRLQADTLTDPAARDSFLESQQRIHSMALAHEHLYQSRSLGSINMAQYISSLVKSIRRSHGQSASSIEIKLQIADIELDIEQTVPLGLIISELATNSFKHAFMPLPADRRGELWIKLMPRNENGLLLEVGDNGRGIPDDVDIAKPLSMGFHLVQSFVLQLNGQLTVQRQPETVFSIFIPKKR